MEKKEKVQTQKSEKNDWTANCISTLSCCLHYHWVVAVETTESRCSPSPWRPATSSLRPRLKRPKRLFKENLSCCCSSQFPQDSVVCSLDSSERGSFYASSLTSSFSKILSLTPQSTILTCLLQQPIKMLMSHHVTPSQIASISW